MLRESVAWLNYAIAVRIAGPLSSGICVADLLIDAVALLAFSD